jgi:hypothetical protein
MLQCHALPDNCSTFFTTGYKRFTEGGCEAFCIGAFCFLTGKAFGFWMKRGFLMWEALEGKGISEGERIAEGELLKKG